jgi:hypothetical protein
MVRTMKVALGTFARNGIEALLGVDLASGVRAALNDFTQRIDSGRPPLALPQMVGEGAAGGSPAVDLDLDDHTWLVLRREAARQGASVAQLTTHAVLVYLAELDRLTPPDGVAA